jgi:hypothetical protein
MGLRQLAIVLSPITTKLGCQGSGNQILIIRTNREWLAACLGESTWPRGDRKTTIEMISPFLLSYITSHHVSQQSLQSSIFFGSFLTISKPLEDIRGQLGNGSSNALLDRSAPRLQYFQSTYSPRLPHSGYISPEAIVALSALSGLESLYQIPITSICLHQKRSVLCSAAE